MASPSRTFYFLVAWLTISTVYLCLCCIEGEGHFGWKCDSVTGCFCKEGQICQGTLEICPGHCVDNPWGVGCQDEPMNLAYGKPVTQTSIYSEGGVNYPGSLAVDGDNGTDNLECSRSKFVHDPTWSVDLGGLYVIRKVAVVIPDRVENICAFGLVELCLNNDTTSRPRIGCRDISAALTIDTSAAVCPTAALEYIIDPPILARHVTIHKKGQQILRLCEVIVRGYAYPYNIAYGKTASQSSGADGGNADNVIDGVVNTTWEGGSCTQTAEQPYPWWKVDLGQQYAVFSVTLFTTTDGSQLTNVRLKSKNQTDDEYSDVCTPLVTTLPSGVGTELTCSPPFVGQILLVQLESKGVLSLCEVTVKGYNYSECAGGMFGPGCRYQSDCNCERAERCSTLTACTAYPYLTTPPSVATRSDTSLTLRWHRWTPLTAPGVGTVQNYVIKAWRDGSLIIDAVVPKDSITGTVGGLSPYVEYNVTITIRSDTGSEGYPSPITTARTCGDPLIPPEPNVTSHLNPSQRSAYMILKMLGMNATDHRCDGFARLNIRYEGQYGNRGMIEVLNVTDSQLINITNLTTYSRYTIRLSAVNNINLEGPAVTVVLTTPEGIPPKMEPPSVASVESTSIEITWHTPSPPGGSITGYEILYTNHSNHWEKILASPDTSKINIDNLQINSTYMFRIRAETSIGFGEYSNVIYQTTKVKSAPGPIIGDIPVMDAVIGGGVGALVLVILVVIGLAVFIRRRRKHKPDRADDSDELQINEVQAGGEPDAPTNQSTDTVCENRVEEHVYGNIQLNTEIPVDDIFNVMKFKTRDVLKAEYAKFPNTLIKPCVAGQKQENNLKNRFKNIMPYDHSRVELELLSEDSNSDYINANYIDGYERPRGFIAAQGPKSNTLKEFWRMIWQVNSPQIVMVTKTMELGKRKCEQYWADDEKKQFGDIEVATLNEVKGHDYFVRTLQYGKAGDSSVRTVKQFHFIGWPDHGVPVDPTALVKFREEVKRYQNQVHRQGPIIVHCSAGVGRTGTFIALDYLFEQAKAEGKIDIFQLVQAMRASRPKMVQTEEQYFFIHDVMLEELHCGFTSIPVHNLGTRLRKLRKRNKSGMTRMEEEFVILNLSLPEIDESSTKAALSAANIEKNRVRNIVAGDQCRPMLMTHIEGSTDYINAVFIDGYQRTDAYIVTQMPMPHTVTDFWSMIYDQQCSTIIMLNEFTEDNKDSPETSVAYWPEESSATYGPFTVEVLSTSQCGHSITAREMRLTYSKRRSGPPRTIRQFCLHGWTTSEPVPPSARTFLELYDTVQNWQKQDGHSAITVHCMNGAHLSGVFCAVSRILDKLRVEQEVDVFHSIKAIRQNRPQLIDSKEQYFFCYEVVEEFGHRYDTYVNFQE